MRERMIHELEKLHAELAKSTGQLQAVEQQRVHLAETIMRLQGAIALAEHALTWATEPEVLPAPTNGAAPVIESPG
jgi:ABC-type cobalamin transport system ATPase subunit